MFSYELVLMLLSLTLCIFVIGVQAFAAFRVCWSASPCVEGRVRLPALAVILIVLVLLFCRPHQDTFQGLDAAAYRLMAHALDAGRGWSARDDVLGEVPVALRRSFLVEPEEADRGNRITRDRSFEIVSLESCATRPFFYPLLPLCMCGLERLAPGLGGDWFIPVMGVLFWGCFVVVSVRRAGVQGFGVAFALLLGSPQPIWLFRGCHVEAVSAALIGTAVLSWMCRIGGLALPALLLGLGVSFHPVMALISIPLVGLFWLGGSQSFRSGLGMIVGLTVGLLPILLLTWFVCAPYGAINLDTIRFNSSIGPALVMAAGLAVLGVLLVASSPWWSRIQLRGWRFGAATGLLAVLCVLPTALALRYWPHGQGMVVLRGLTDMYSALQAPFGLLLLGCVALCFAMRSHGRSLVVLTVVGLSLPLFVYLKGAEFMGLWSHRRAIVSLVLVLVCAVTALCEWLVRLRAAGRTRVAWLLVLVSLCVGAANVVRWPAPYVVRYEAGSDQWVAGMRDRMGSRLVLFDYHPYSAPFAVMPGARVLGLSEFAGWEAGAGICAWVSGRAAVEPVYWATAFGNPGLEDGVVLTKESGAAIDLERVRSKYALPAEREGEHVEFELLAVRSARTNELLKVDKLFDYGSSEMRHSFSLALRGEWGVGLRSLDCPDLGVNVLGRWGRQGSGIVGPVPAPGGRVEVHIEAGAGQLDEEARQRLAIVAPWGGTRLELTVRNGLTVAEGVMIRPVGDTNELGRTGVYRIVAEEPYDPGKEGVRGYPDDLVALFHRMRIVELPEWN